MKTLNRNIYILSDGRKNAVDDQKSTEIPDSFTIDELIEQLIFMEKVEEGYQQSAAGKVISNEDVKLMIDKWSK